MKRRVRELERLRHYILEIDGTDLEIGELEKLSKLARKKALAWYEKAVAGSPTGDKPVLIRSSEQREQREEVEEQAVEEQG